MSAHPDWILMGLSIALVVFACVRTIRMFSARRRFPDVPERNVLRIAPVLLSLVGSIAAAFAIWKGLPPLVDEVSFRTSAILATAIIFSALLQASSTIMWPGSLDSGKRFRAFISATSIAVMGLAAAAFVTYLRGYSGQPVTLALPVRGGPWAVVAGGRLGLTNYHHGQPATQNYALDLVCVKPNETEGQPVFAPASGRVVRSETNWQEGDSSAEGNFVELQNSDNTLLMFAHLRSVRVSSGEEVTLGQLIGECGSTGNAERAHLHLHAQREGVSVPMLFQPHVRFLIRGDRVP